MSDEIHEIGEVEVILNTMTEEVTNVGSEPAIDWENLPENEPAPPVDEPATYPAARGPWDFTDTQRIILALLIWLNLMMLGLGYLAITGKI